MRNHSILGGSFRRLGIQVTLLSVLLASGALAQSTTTYHMVAIDPDVGQVQDGHGITLSTDVAPGTVIITVVDPGGKIQGTVVMEAPDSVQGTYDGVQFIHLGPAVFHVKHTLSALDGISITNRGNSGAGGCGGTSNDFTCDTNGVSTLSTVVQLDMNINLLTKSGLRANVIVGYRWNLVSGAVGSGDTAQPERAAISPSAPSTTDKRFTVVHGPAISGSCRFRKDGPLIIDIPVTRYAGATRGDGTLADPQTLKSNGVVSATAKLRIMAWDVDSDAPAVPGQSPEVDLVTMNGQNVGPQGTVARLTGSDKSYFVSEFEVPIEIIKFAQVDPLYLVGKATETKNPAPNVTRPIPGVNRVQIDIDDGNKASGKNVWCTAVEWVSLSFGAMAPVMLVHGTHAQLDSWTFKVDTGRGAQSPVDWFSARGFVFDHRINMIADGSFEENGALLQAALTLQATALGVRNFHLITHSKGTSDSRSMLFNDYNPGQPFTVLSLYSIGTPSQGTILSDIAVAAEKVPFPRSSEPIVNKALFDGLLADIAARFNAAPKDPARTIQMIGKMTEFNKRTPLYPPSCSRAPLPTCVFRYAIAGNADANGDKKMQLTEVLGLLPDFAPDRVKVFFGNRVYEALGRIQTLTINERTTYDLLGANTTYYLAKFEVSKDPQSNDLVSTAASTLYNIFEPLGQFTFSIPSQGSQAGFQTLKGTYPWNHFSLKNDLIMNLIVKQIQKDFPLGKEEPSDVPNVP